MSKLIVAIPSKGRLMEATAEFFAKSGMKVSRAEGARNYTGRISGVENVEVRFMSAGEIVQSGSPSDLLRAPANNYVSGLLETPRRQMRAIAELDR